MPIISFAFIALVMVVFVLLRLIARVAPQDKQLRLSNATLILASFVFVSYLDWHFALILAALSFATYYFARKKETISIGIIAAIGVLAYFKYTHFFINSFMSVLGNDFVLTGILLPLGLSYYTFSAISYLVDVKREKLEPRSFEQVLLYLAFFPKLTAGPIQRSKNFFSQSEQLRHVGWSTFAPGIQIFAFGLFKKIVLADRLAVYVGQVFDTPLAFGSLTVFLAALSYTLQIYFDFSGYSDMAIGAARILGIKIPRNFNLPFASRSVGEFWKRWHISFSTFLFEYVYVALGGNRKGVLRKNLNLSLTFIIGGLWHVANWSFVVWGIMQSIALIIHKSWQNFRKKLNIPPSIFGQVLSVLITFIFTIFSMIFVRQEYVADAFAVVARIFSFDAGLEHYYLWTFVSAALLIISTLMAYRRSKKLGHKDPKTGEISVEGYYPIRDLSKFWNLVIFFVFIGITLALAYTGGSNFIYGEY